MQIDKDIQQKLDVYLHLLRKWQPKINLISNNTLDNAWERHFEDSLQLLGTIPESAKIWMDIGSGAGFPGLVLAIARDDLEMHLVESDQKKCAFLKTVSRETNTNIIIHNDRVENIDRGIVPDVISARALASLVALFDYCSDWIEKNPDLRLIFPKGSQADTEFEMLDKYWRFDCCTYPSKTEEQAKILVFSDICRL